jgi:peptidoglycan/LPS O-acetylase OafA/YrhL
MKHYRKDIDGIRAIAVLSIIFFHFDLLPQGYLGVDVFFVISGFLITGLIYEECKEKRFSIKQFYFRRIRRIIPLVSVSCLVALVAGMFVMLPDDLENLAESIIATDLFSNNILQAITTKNYWDVVNEFKPLMHTWSLGVEEQYYLFFPFLVFIFLRKRFKWILPALMGLTILSIILYILPFSASDKFYYLPFRFFELSFGGIFAVLLKINTLNKTICTNIKFYGLVLLICLLTLHVQGMPDIICLCLIVATTCCILVSTNDRLSYFILENKCIAFVGKISFSLYIWHQIILAYIRYFIDPKLDGTKLISVFAITAILSVLSYYLIEQPFRNKTKVNNRLLFVILAPSILISLSISLWLYNRSGIIRDIPELEITKSDIVKRLHIQYNNRVYVYDKPFMTKNKCKILIIGDSFARDFVNVLLESKFNNMIEISYSNNEQTIRINSADIIFFASSGPASVDTSSIFLNMKNVFRVGTKNWGINNGIFYNYKGNDYFEQRTHIEKIFVEWNIRLKSMWKNKYIDLIAYVIDEEGKVPVFTPDHKFISQDCRHFCRAGAVYFATLIGNDNNFILNKIIHKYEPNQ